MFDQAIDQFLSQLKQNNLFRDLAYLSRDKKRIDYQTKDFIDFASNDYLGLSQNNALKNEFSKAIKKYGTGGKASSLVYGYGKTHFCLAEKIKEKTNQQSVLLFSSAYSANIGTISALSNIKTNKQKIIFQDRLNHASLLDGALLANTPMIRYKHRDYQDLRQKIDKFKAKDKLCLIISDAVFSMDGDLADIEQLIECKKYAQALLMIDDAHGFMLDYALTKKQLQQIDIYSVSFAKALGANGAFIATSKKIGDYLTNCARSFIYSTAINPALAHLVLKNIQWIENNPHIKQKLRRNIDFFIQLADKYQLKLISSNSAIQAVIIGENKKCLQISADLINQGYLVAAIRYPTVPKNTARIRICIHADQSLKQIKNFTIAISKAIKKAINN